MTSNYWNYIFQSLKEGITVWCCYLTGITSTTLLADDTKYAAFPDWCCCLLNNTVYCIPSGAAAKRILKTGILFFLQMIVGLVRFRDWPTAISSLKKQ